MMASALLERGVILFALWTGAVQLNAMTAGNLYDLLALFILLGVLGGMVGRRLKLGPAPSFSEQSFSEQSFSEQSAKIQSILFGLTALAAVLLTLTAHRPDEDDAFYLNLAVSAADVPTEAVQWFDHQSATEPPSLIKRPTRLTSLGPLAAMASWLTGIPAIYFPHLLFLVVAALAVLLANRELFRLLAPKYWAYGVLAVVVVLTADGELHRSYGNFSFVRLHQGKGILLSALVPLLITWGLRFAHRPTRRAWLLLTAAQVAATGCSSTGFFVGPIVANLAVFTGVLASPARTWRTGVLARGFLTSLYSLALVLWSRWHAWSYMIWMAAEDLPGHDLDLSEQVAMVSASGFFAAFQIFVLLTAWLWCRNTLARRLCLVFPGVLLLVFLNSWIAGAIGSYLIPIQVYWRVFWILPWPTMAALVLIAPLLHPRWGPKTRYGLYALSLALVLGPVSRQSIYSPSNGVEMRLPGLKVPAEYAVAKRIAEYVDGRPNVLVDAAVSAWLPTLHQHPYPLISRYLYANRSRFGDELQPRLALKLFIDGRGKAPMNTARFEHQLDHFRIALVSFKASHPWRAQIRPALQQLGFERFDVAEGHELWRRGPKLPAGHFSARKNSKNALP